MLFVLSLFLYKCCCFFSFCVVNVVVEKKRRNFAFHLFPVVKDILTLQFVEPLFFFTFCLFCQITWKKFLFLRGVFFLMITKTNIYLCFCGEFMSFQLKVCVCFVYDKVCVPHELQIKVFAARVHRQTERLCILLKQVGGIVRTVATTLINTKTQKNFSLFLYILICTT